MQHLNLIGWILLSFSGGVVGAICTRRTVNGWYKALRKPSWTPPNWLFGPVWTVLYIMMGTAACMIWEDGGFQKHSFALSMYLLQLLFNFLWSPLFFAANLLAISLIDMVALWATLLLTIVLFMQINVWAGVLLIPYIFWVSYAASLNFAVWRLNSK